MFTSGIWSSSEDYCYYPPGFLESLSFVVVFIFFLIVFLSVYLIIFSRVSLVECVAISSGVISFRMQNATHIFNVVIPSGLENFLDLSAIATVLSGPRFLS